MLHDVVLAPGTVLGIPVLGSGEVEMQDDLVASGGMLTTISAVEGRIRSGDALQVDQPGEAAQVAGQRGAGHRFQQQGGALDLFGHQLRGGIGFDQFSPFAQHDRRHTARVQSRTSPRTW